MPTDFSSLVVETLEAPLPTGTVLSSVVVETLEAPLPTGTILSSVVIETLENPNLPVAVVGNIVGTAGSPATFDGSGSTAGAYAWDWTAVPGGSAIANAGIPFSDSGSSDTFDMTDNAVLYHLDGNANDTSGNSQNGTEVGSPAYAAGYIGAQAISLDGTTGQYVSVSNSPTVTITGDISIAAWVNMDLTGDGFQRVVAKATGGSGTGGYALIVHTDGSVYLGLSGSNISSAGGSVTASTWTHVVGVWDSATGTGKIYVDGVELQSGTLPAPGSSTADLHIGADPASPGTRDFKGLLDEVAIWNRTLSGSEIRAAYLMGSGAGGDNSSLTFTPDVAGTYTVQLTAIVEDSGGVILEDTATADAVIAAAPPPSSGDNSVIFAGDLGSPNRSLISGSIIKRIVKRKK